MFQCEGKKRKECSNVRNGKKKCNGEQKYNQAVNEGCILPTISPAVQWRVITAVVFVFSPKNNLKIETAAYVDINFYPPPKPGRRRCSARSDDTGTKHPNTSINIPEGDGIFFTFFCGPVFFPVSTSIMKRNGSWAPWWAPGLLFHHGTF